MKLIQTTLIMCFFVVVISGCEGNIRKHEKQIQHSFFSEKVDQYIKGWVANNRFKGNLLIAKGDTILYSKSVGFAIREFDIANSDTTQFLIG